MVDSEELNTIPQMREHIKTLEGIIKKQDSEMDGLRSQNRLMSAREAFRDAGYLPNHAELFVGVNPEGEISPEAIDAFVNKHGLAVQGGSTEAAEEGEGTTVEAETEADTDESADLADMSGGGTRAGTGGAAGARTDNTMSRDEWREMHKRDPVAARRAVDQGRVRIRGDNPFAG